MTSYFDIIPKEVFILILNKLGGRIFNGIIVAYPRFSNIFSNVNFWKNLVKVYYPDAVKLSLNSGVYFWQQVYKSFSGSNGWDSLISGELDPTELKYLYIVKKQYPLYYDIYKTVNIYCSGISKSMVTWKDIYEMTDFYGNLDYYQIADQAKSMRQKLAVKGYGESLVIYYYVVDYIKKMLNDDYPGDISNIIYASIYNYDIYNKLLNIFSPSKKVLIDTINILTDFDAFGVYQKNIISETEMEKAQSLVREDFEYRVSMM